MMEAENFSETSVYFHHTAPRHVVEDSEIFGATYFDFVIPSVIQRKTKKNYNVALQFVGLKTTDVSVTRRKFV
jgi:hypothetical protein